MSTALALPHLASRLFGTPLLAHPGKLEVIVNALSPRLLGHKAQEGDDEEGQAIDREPSVEGSVATIPVLGSLVHRRLGMDAISGMDSTQDLRARVEAALADDSVGGILLELDSPGGEVAGIFDLADVIFEGRQSKPIVAFVNENAFSAGFAIASAADRIVLPRTGGVGSVGVVAMHVDQSALNEAVGIKPTFVFAGDRKVDLSPHSPLSERARADLQAGVDKIQTTFVETVARNRGISTEAVRATQAGVFTGQDAITRGFADEIGGKNEALAALRQLMEAQGGDVMTMVKIERNEFDGLKAEAAKVPGLEAKVASQAEALAEAQRTMEALQAEREAARESAHEAVIDGVIQACMQAKVTPPTEDERQKIRKALKADEELGRFMADQVKERILASGRAGKVSAKPLDPNQSEADAKRAEFLAKYPTNASKA
jgi:signal peptide peptidase SppA